MAGKRKPPSFAKVVVFVNALVPIGLILYDGMRGRLGANPVEFVLRTTGLLALFFLALSLAVTPARRLLGLASVAQHRRGLGLFAFTYACLHVIVYTVLEKGFGLGAVIADVFARPFIAVGMASFLMLVPLAATSTNGMIKRLGGPAWRRIHRLAYVVAAAAVVHFYMLVKADVRTPLVYAVIVASLLGYRAVVAMLAAMRARRATGTAA